MINHNDPVGSGLAASLSRPTGNVTGMSIATPALRGKQLQLLKEVVPKLTSVAVLWNPSSPSLELRDLELAGRGRWTCNSKSSKRGFRMSSLRLSRQSRSSEPAPSSCTVDRCTSHIEHSS